MIILKGEGESEKDRAKRVQAMWDYLLSPERADESKKKPKKKGDKDVEAGKVQPH